MPQRVIRFKGINRNINEFQSSGECEELINIRTTPNGSHVVRDKRIVFSGADGYKSINEHVFGAQSNLIAITDDSLLWVSDTGEVKQQLISPISAKFVSNAGNVLFVTCDDGSNLMFKFENGRYTQYESSIPFIDMYVQLDGFGAAGSHSEPVSSFNNVGEARDGLSKAYSNFYAEHTHGLAGPIVVGCTFELEDGNEVWSTGFTVVDPSKDVRYEDPKFTGVVSVGITGAATATLKFTVSNYRNISGVKNIKFYSSVPLIPYEVEDANGTYSANKIDNGALNLAGQNMYLQKVLSFRGFGEFKLNTEHTLAAEPLMPVTTGMIHRYGEAKSYNNRFHFYNSSVYHPAQLMSSGVHSNRQLPAEDTYNDIRRARLYAVIENDEKRTFVMDPIPDVRVGEVLDLIYPMGGIKEGYLETSDTGFSTSTWYKIDFSDSTAYNYSCAMGWQMNANIVSKPSITNLIEAHGQTVLVRTEPNAINVSAPYNPFVFPVEYSYGVGGKIIDISTSYLPISSTQVGQYPITIFTTSGVYALEQGDGSVLYSNITPIQPLVMDGSSTTTPFGTFFISAKNLYLLSGRQQANVSYVLNGERELYIRELDSYRRLCMSTSGGFFNFEPLLSGEDFEDFVNDVSLTYDQLNNELYISSGDENIKYSYVLNIDTKEFHKVAKKYSQTQGGSRYAIETEGDSTNVVDMYIEEKGSQPVFIQSRPMPLDLLYSHIERLLLLVDAKLTGNQYLCLSVFASDNLHDWKCIISSQKRDTVLRQIRTNRAAKSYRDYIIVINGVVHTDTDISDIIADYTTMTRRIG